MPAHPRPGDQPGSATPADPHLADQAHRHTPASQPGSSNATAQPSQDDADAQPGQHDAAQQPTQGSAAAAHDTWPEVIPPVDDPVPAAAAAATPDPALTGTAEASETDKNAAIAQARHQTGDLPEDTDADAAAKAHVSGHFGLPGPPLSRRNPFLIGLTGGLGVIVAYGIFLGLRNAASILVLIFIALFLAIGLNPAITRMQSWGLPRWLAVTTMALTVVALLCGGVVALIPPVVTQTGQLVENVPDFITSLQRSKTVNELITRYDVMSKVQGAINAGTVTNALGGVVGGAKLLFGTIFNVLTVIVLTIYFMAAFERIKRAGYALVPASRRTRVQLLTDEILAKVGAYMVGALAIAVLAGLSTWVFAVVVGLAYPFALAVVVAVCDLIPQIGATLGAVIVSLIGLADSLTTGIICIVFFIIYQQIENYLIYPNVMKRSVKVSDVAAVTAALLGVALFGVIGALVAIPMVAAIQLIVREVVNPSMERK